MSEDLLHYDVMIENALREVVRQTLVKVVANGLPGDHHFYITFLTTVPGVEIPDYLKKQYPSEMTIVLQYQFFGLTVNDDSFSVMLSFNNQRERLHIPFAAITTFADPSVNFALQFQSSLPDEGEGESESPASAPSEKERTSTEDKKGEVISLDKFRKK
jgi:hypothetical protein